VVLSCSILAGCGGSSSGTNSSANPNATTATLALSASPSSVTGGGFSTLTWNASNVQSCDASGGWSGSKGVSGSESVGPIDADRTFRLSCSGDGGGVSRQVTVSVDSGAGPTVTLQAQPEQVAANGSASLTWLTQDATGCTASGGWTGSKPPSGSFSTGPLTRTTSYSLSCTGPSGNALASVTVEVLDKVLSWQAPTQNVDGSPLTDLAGYKVYWGTQSRSYGAPVVINDPAVTRWEADLPPGVYYFALTAFDAAGSESGYSNEVIKTIP
jgi:hypothetical protein